MIKLDAADAGGGGGRGGSGPGQAGTQQLSDLLLVFPELPSLPLRVQTLSPPPPPPLAHVLEALAAGGRGRSRKLEFYSLASSLHLKTHFEIFQTVQLKE